MNGKLFLFGAICLATLPSCMHPVDQVLQANAETRQQSVLDHGTVAQGACDSVGQYAAQATSGERLTMQTPTQTAYLVVR